MCRANRLLLVKCYDNMLCHPTTGSSIRWLRLGQKKLELTWLMTTWEKRFWRQTLSRWLDFYCETCELGSLRVEICRVGTWELGTGPKCGDRYRERAVLQFWNKMTCILKRKSKLFSVNKLSYSTQNLLI